MSTHNIGFYEEIKYAPYLFFCNKHENNMTSVTRKPVTRVFVQVRHKLGCTAIEKG